MEDGGRNWSPVLFEVCFLPPLIYRSCWQPCWNTRRVHEKTFVVVFEAKKFLHHERTSSLERLRLICWDNRDEVESGERRIVMKRQQKRFHSPCWGSVDAENVCRNWKAKQTGPRPDVNRMSARNIFIGTKASDSSRSSFIFIYRDLLFCEQHKNWIMDLFFGCSAEDWGAETNSFIKPQQQYWKEIFALRLALSAMNFRSHTFHS